MTVDQRIPLWIDCDPGQDDIVAIAIGCYDPHFKLVGVSTVHGNSTLHNTTKNTLRFLTAIGRMDIPVYPGCAEPLEGALDGAPEVHGQTGLNGSRLLPEPEFEAHKRTEFFPALKEQIEKYDGKLCIAGIAPLTNIAKFFKKYPELKGKIRYLTIMGGGFKRFNRKGVAEFNIYDDALAAREVLMDPVLAPRILLAPLDTTSKTRADKTIRSKILGSDSVEEASNFRALMYELIHFFYLQVKKRKGPDYVGPSVHDPTAVAALLDTCGFNQDLNCQYIHRAVNVEVGGDRNGAMEMLEEDDSGSKISILTSMNIDAFWKIVFDTYDAVDKKAHINEMDRAKLIKDYKP